MALGNVPRCQHVKMNGTQCGSPALHWRRRCFFHDRIRRERAKIAADGSAPRRFDLPLLEDANSVQVALMKVIQMLGSGCLDHKTAGLILYALQTASVNLRYADFEPDEVTDVVIDRDTVEATDIGGPQWFEDDFEEPEDDDGESQEADDVIEAEADDEDTGAGLPVNAQAVPENAAEPPRLSIEEARMKVQGAIRNWVLESVGEKIAAESS